MKNIDAGEVNIRAWSGPASSRETRQVAPGFTLIEMIGILAVIAILAVALIPILIKQMDQIAADREIKQLKTFADGLRQQVVKNRFIPDHTSWDSMIASNVGLSISQVRTNGRRVARAFLIDPNFQLQRSGESSPSNPPYTQNVGGSIIYPTSPRLMILSSMAQALPVSSGINNAFNTIWNTEEGKVPADSAWNGYQKGDDLKIQRIHLSDLFVQLVLNSDGSVGGEYTIDGNPAAIPSSPTPRYFLDSSLLELYDCGSTNGVPAYSEILHRSKSFSFISCSWQQGDDSVTRALERPGPLDLQLAVNKFLSLTNHNPWRDGWPTVNSTNKVLPTHVHDTMTNYMIRYINWRAANPNAPSGDQDLQAAQTDLDHASLWLIDPNGTPAP